MREREELRREFSFENAIPNGPWYTFDTEKALDEITTLRSQLAAITEARDLWQSEAGIQQAHRERAEKRITELEEVVKAFQSWHQKTGPDSLPLLTEAVSKLNEFSMPKPSPA